MASLNGHLGDGLAGVPADDSAGVCDGVSAGDPAKARGLRPSFPARLRGQFRLYVRAIAYFKNDWGAITLMLALVGVSIGLGLLLSWPMAVLIDSVLTPTPRADWGQRLFLAPLPAGMFGRVIGVALLSMLLWIAQHALTLVKAMINNRINNFGVMRVRNQLFHKLQTLDLAFHQQQPQADAMYRVCNDTQGVKDILNVLLNALMAVVELGMMIGIMLSKNVPLTVYGLSVAPVLIFINWKFGAKIRKRNVRAKEVDTDMVSLVQRSMATVGLVQAFGRQGQESAHFQSSTLRTARAWLKLNWAQEAYYLIVRAVFAVGGAVIFGYGGYLVWRDQFAHPVADGMTLGTLGVFMDYLTNKLWNPLNRLTSVAADIQPGVAGAQRVFEVLDRQPTVTDRPGALALAPQPRTLSLCHVEFEYQLGKPVLRDVSVTVAPGQMVAFVGASGAGKSTLMNLLPRFYDPKGGSIELDEIDVRQVRLADLRRHIALVPQESQLLPATIAENIAYGSPGATRAQVERAAELAGAAGFIDTLPLGYDTRVSEGGQNLSGGQRQRLALARALATEAPILVLDEPTSALDPHHEKLITETLTALKGRRTIILVSHRLGTVAGCDQIVVMDQGRVVEQGRHAQLMAGRGYYSRMVKEQQGLDGTPPKRNRAA